MLSPVEFFLKHPLLSPIRVAGLSLITRALARRNMVIAYEGDEAYRKPARDLIRRVRQETPMVLVDDEAYNIYALAARTARIPGDLAELGVFKGGSARLICEVKGDRELHLFDTFAGLPEVGKSDPEFGKGGFASSFEKVQSYLSSFANVSYHVGLFPETANGLEHLRFSFVHLDVDLYSSTLSGLTWFYPRLNRGAVLVSHDYVNALGVRQAFEEFFADKPECLLELSGTQVACVKL